MGQAVISEKNWVIAKLQLKVEACLPQLDRDQLELVSIMGIGSSLAWLPCKRKLLLSKLSMVAELVLSSFDVHLGSFLGSNLGPPEHTESKLGGPLTIR